MLSTVTLVSEFVNVLGVTTIMREDKRRFFDRNRRRVAAMFSGSSSTGREPSPVSDFELIT